MLIFIIEAVFMCIAFTGMLQIAIRNRQTAFVNDYPPVVTDKLRQLGMIAQKPPARKKDILRKLLAIVVYVVLFALLLRYVNGIETFGNAVLTAYGLWLVVDWYDFLVVDILLAPFDRFYKASGVSAFDRDAVYFHFKGSLRGMVIGIVFAPIVGLLVMLL